MECSVHVLSADYQPEPPRS